MKRLLIVEDEADFRVVLRCIFEPAGYAVDAVESAEQAWEKLSAARPPDLAFVDWNLPGQSGVELCRRLRGNERLRHIPLVLLTVRNLPDDQISGLNESGADMYLTKPIDPEEILARVESLLANLREGR